MKWPSEYFEPKEILSPDGLLLWERDILPVRKISLIILDKYRSFVDEELLCNYGEHRLRGFRSCKEFLKTKEPDQTYSFHLQCAFDISCNVKTPRELYEMAREFNKKAGFYHWGGVGLYPWGVHLDCRDTDWQATYWSKV